MKHPIVALALSLSLLGAAHPAPPAAWGEGDASFRKFCGEWMRKLDSRELRNRGQATNLSSEPGVVLEYVGYADTLLNCQTRPHPTVGMIGKIVYHELRLRQRGATRAGALANHPTVLHRLEVIEFFRIESGRWVY